MRHFFIITIFWFCFNHSFGQPASLSHETMLEDFDFLQYTITKYCAFIPLLEMRTGIEINKELGNIKKEITPNTTIKDFTEIIRKSLNILHDGHTQITNASSVKWFATSPHNYLSSLGNVSLSDTLLADFYYKLISDSVYAQSQSGIRVKYMDGKYYNARYFYHNNKPINIGEEIKAINGTGINEFIQKNYPHMYYLKWDNKNKLLYTDFFMLALPLMGMDQFLLTIGEREISINSKSRVDSLRQEAFRPRYKPEITSIGDSLLYIFMPMMMNKDWYINKLKNVYTHNMKKIIIDIRGNGGGDDNVWAEFMQHIMDRPFQYKFSVGMTSSEILKKAVSSF